MKYLIFFLLLAQGAFAQIDYTKKVTKLPTTYTVDEVVNSSYQKTYRVTNIYDLSTNDVTIRKSGTVTDITVESLYQLPKTSKSNMYEIRKTPTSSTMDEEIKQLQNNLLKTNNKKLWEN